jgi:chromosome segregation ATPase
MNQSAAAVTGAVSSVQQAAERLARLIEQMATSQSALLQTTHQLTQSTGVLGSASQSLANATTAIGNTTSRFEAIAQVTRTEADIRAQLLSDLRVLTDQSRAAGQSLASLSDEVQGHLVANVESFGTSVSKVLSQHLMDYQKQLGDAISMLKSALEDLAELTDR